jgi:hypothetical protein
MKSSRFQPLLFTYLYVAELSGLVVALYLYKKNPAAAEFFVPSVIGRRDLFAAFALTLTLLSIAGIYRYYVLTRRDQSRDFTLVLCTNLVSLVFIVVSSEVTLRLTALKTAQGVSILTMPLRPYSWNDVADHYREILNRNLPENSYFIYDPDLGWVVGPSRRSKDGLYFSSTEGIRSAGAGVSFTDISTHHRVAIVGDSFTFGLEVKYEDTWAYHLERTLGPDARVLNFGVDGYGVDQSYLRFQRDVRNWRPDIVLFGLIEHDVWRSMAVYSFISFPQWDFPFAKPRFSMDSGLVELLNRPLPRPDTLFAKKSIQDLPYIEYDPGYHEQEWTWHPYHHSMLIRVLLSRFWPQAESNLKASPDIVKQINGSLMLKFMSAALADGAVPITVYFPSRQDFWPTPSLMAKTIFREAGIPYIDLTSCVAAIDPADRFLPGRPHYSAKANEAVAHCLSELMPPHMSNSL